MSSVAPRIQTSRLIHFDKCVNALAGPKGNCLRHSRRSHGIAIHGDDLKLMARKSDLFIFDRAGVQQMHENALSRLHANGLACAENFVVDRIHHGRNFEAIRPRIEHGRLFGLRRRIVLLVRVHIFTRKKRLPIAQGEKQFLIIVAGIFSGVDHEKTELPGISALMKVITSHGMGVIPAGASGPGGELVAAAAVRRHDRRSFFFGTIDFGGNQQAVPAYEFRLYPCQLITSTVTGTPSFTRRTGPGHMPL